MDRVFHHQFTLVAKCAIVLFTLFSLWCFLRIDRGRLSRHKDIRVADIVKVIPMQTAFGASRYLLVKYGPNRLISLQPDDQKAFMSELKKRQ